MLVFAICVPVALALFHAWRASQGFSAIRRVVGAATTPLKDVVEGPIEVEGIIEALDAPVVAPSGRAAVFADVELTATRASGRSTVRVHHAHTRRSVAAVLVGTDGTRVGLDFEHIEVVGAPSTFYEAPASIEPGTRAWAADVPSEAQRLQFDERIVPVGAHVVVSGRARVVDAVVYTGEDAGSAGYRDGVPVEKRTFVIEGSPDARLLVTEGTGRQLWWRASWPVAVLLMTCFGGLTYAGILLAVLLE